MKIPSQYLLVPLFQNGYNGRVEKIQKAEMNLHSLKKLRKELHSKPELSGSEKWTSQKVTEVLKTLKPDQLITEIGGYGIAAKFSSTGEAKQTLLFRAELDGIAVEEKTGLDYQSTNNGVMHGCGHDGHMAILLGLASELHQQPPEMCDVWLLFQPAEETGMGAAAMLADRAFDEIEADQAFALHNLPGFAEHLVLVKREVFAAASVGLEISFEGRSSHAAYPEEGINPSDVMSELTLFVNREFDEFQSGGALNKIVTTYIKLGERAFGISPGDGRIGFTVRSESDEWVEKAVKKVEKKIGQLRKNFDGQITMKKTEPFAATVNHAEGVDGVISAAERLDLKVEEMSDPFPWSEDFGEFRQKFPITLFGLGSGEGHPPLHSETYDFNEKLIATGVKLFREIIDGGH
ncbi:amidohydrolase [Rhodohalobacter halophilus]|uniref:amidohydrolase n=1 Tax=Rhodohalobacter halophilus TaxID=1812810 RepID=UPI00159F2F16|nr:amidohydrolase [Rhodohalobacter halophilus]